MPVPRPESSDSRIIAHVDMDCFYVQVEQRKQPNLRGQPTAVVQYNSWKGGGLIAVSYEARKFGVKRSMRGDDAKEVCPQIQLVRVPEARGKADLGIYRNAGSEVVSILSRKGRCERASIDEVYLDLTDAAETMLEETPLASLETIDEEVLKSHVLGLNMDGSDAKETIRQWLCRSDADHRDKLLACGALIIAELRLQVLKESGFTCSAGVAHNKMLAKLASGMHKPAQQTVVPFSSVRGLLEHLPVKKMKQLGGKLGSSLQVDLGVNTVGDLLQFSIEKLQDRYGVNTGTWLWNVARGISGEEVEGRLLPKSHGSGKTFPGPRALKTVDSVEQWLNELCEELSERLHSDLDQNKRIAHTLTLHANAHKSTDSDSHKKFPSKSCPLRYGTAKIQEDAFSLFQAGLREYLGSYHNLRGNQCSGWRITGLSVSASKIVPIPAGTCAITKYFHGQDQHQSSPKQSDKLIPVAAPLSPLSHSKSCSTEPQTACGVEDSFIKNDMPNGDQKEERLNMCKDEDPSCSSSKQARDDAGGEVLRLPCTDGGSVLKQTKVQSAICREESRIKDTMDRVRSQERKRKKLEEKGNPSIRRFFQSQDSCCSSMQEHINSTQGTKSSLSGNPSEEALHQEGGQSRMDSWMYKIDEIDPAIVNELPLEIRAEVRAWLRPQKQANTVKRGSSIDHYFLPDKKS